MTEHNFAGLLRALCDGRVNFIVVGGLAAVLHGAPISTLDVDVVHSRDAANVERLLAVLQSLDAVYRIQPERRLRPNAAHLASPGHLNLITRLGPLDLLGTIGSGLGYDDLLPNSSSVDLGAGNTVRILDLDMLITLKEQLATDKDRAALPILRRTLELRRNLTGYPQQIVPGEK